MKNEIFFLFFTCMMLTFTACGGSASYDNSKVSGSEKSSEYSTYKEAIAANDFEAVHKILSMAETEIAKTRGSWNAYKDFAEKFGFEANEYELKKVKLEVLKSELTFLVSQKNEELNDRVVFLINENSELLKKKNKFDEYCNHVATLAANQENEELVKKIAEQFQSPSLFFENSAVAKYGKGKDFYEEMKYDYLRQGIDIPRPQLGLVKSNYYGDLDNDYEKYIKAISTYNKLCLTAMKDALDADDANKARKISKFVKKNIKYQDLGDWCQVVEKDYGSSSAYEAFKVTEDDSDIQEAKRILNQY